MISSISTFIWDQESADKRIPEILRISAKIRWISCEGLRESVNLMPYFVNVRHQKNTATGETRIITEFEGVEINPDTEELANYGQTATQYKKPIDFIVVGKEPLSEFELDAVNQCKSVNVGVLTVSKTPDPIDFPA